MFCGELSYDYVTAALQGWAVHIVKIPGLYRLTTSDYNKFLTDPNFWRRFKEEKLLIFQTDSILTSADIDAFMDYDMSAPRAVVSTRNTSPMAASPCARARS